MLRTGDRSCLQIQRGAPVSCRRTECYDAGSRFCEGQGGARQMNLNTITALKRPDMAEQITDWRAGYAWLAGGTWLFSEPQIATDTLIDLAGLKWPALKASAEGLDLAATCPIQDIYMFAAPPEWRAAPLFKECADALLMSWKIQHVATVGGNICMSLPAGAMIS